MNVPKIIHQIAPRNKENWHPLWERCYESWRREFPDFQFIVWNDEDDIDDLVKQNFPEHYDVYMRFPFRMMNIDLAKNAILHTIGGIFCDMDQYCYENFWDILDKDACLLQNSGTYEALKFDTDYIDIENSLIISAPKHILFRKIVDSIIDKFLYCEEIGWTSKELKFSIMETKKIDNATYNARLVEEITGSYLIGNVYNEMVDKSKIQILPKTLFTNLYNFSFEKKFKTLHIYTKYWGKESIQYLEDSDLIDKTLSMEQKLIEYFLLGIESKDRDLAMSKIDRMLSHDPTKNTSDRP